MGKFHRVSGIAAMAGQGRQWDGMSAQGDDVVGADHALVMQAQAAGQIEATRQAAEVARGLGGGTGEALVVVGAEALEHGVGLLQGGGAGEAKFADQTVLAGAPGALDAALGLGRVGGNLLDAEFLESPSELGRRLFSGELFGQGPVGIVALEDAVAVAVEAEGYAVRGDQGVQGAEIADSIFGFELEVGGQDLAGGVILKADERELGAAALEPVMTAGIGERHHAEAWAGRAVAAILARPALLRRGQFGGPQDAAYGLAADGEVFLDPKFFREMGIVEALILAAGQGQDQLLLGRRQSPRHGASAIAVQYPADGIGLIAAFEALHLAFTQLQQAGGFAYAQPPAHCILNHFHPLELFLTHRHHPYRVTKSRCSYGVTLSWSIYTLPPRSCQPGIVTDILQDCSIPFCASEECSFRCRS